MFKKGLCYLLKIILAGIISLILLSIFTLIYKYTGVHIKNNSGAATDYKWEPNQWMATMQEGFAWFKMDKKGFNNAIYKDDTPDILIMGSSHMEAVQMKPTENVAYLLNKELSEYYTYNIGISGHNIYTCVKNINNAVDVYKPKRYVILEISQVKLEINNMKEVIDNTYPIIPSYDSGIMYKLQKNLPAIKEIYNALNNWKNTDESINNNVQKEYSQEYINALNDFLAKAEKPFETIDAELIIFYHPPTSIDNNGNFKEETDLKALQLFEEACKNNNIKFIDMTSDFKKLYENKHILAHGFINTSIGKGHLNKYGHSEIANRISEFIKKNEEDINGAK